jgi:hypothetical protein
MMNAVHVRRHHQLSKIAIEQCGQADISVIEHRGCVEQDLEEEHAQCRSPELATAPNLISMERMISIG